MALRAFVWLLALSAFVLPPAILPAAAATSTAHAAMSDCPYHATPPENCPDKLSHKHAVGLCCLVMLHVIALLPTLAGEDRIAGIGRPAMLAVADLVGLTLNEDPPPPRV